MTSPAKAKQKILIISNLVYPLRNPLFKELSERGKFLYKFLFLRRTLGNRRWSVDTSDLRFNYKVIPSLEIPIRGHDYFPFLVNPTIFFDLMKEKPDVVISIGWAYPANFAAFLFCKLFKKKFLLWNESTQHEKSWRRLISSVYVKFLVSHSDGYLASGERAKDYLISMGANSQKIEILGNAINNAYYKEAAKEVNCTKVREELGFTDSDFVILYVGRFERVKGIDILVDAFSQVLQKSESVKLLLIGYGSMEEEIRRNTKNLSKDGKIKILSAMEREDIVPYYACSNVLVLPSRSETWGYTVNEALASSLPVVVSTAVGSSDDLVRQGVNGLVFKTGKAEELAKALLEVVTNKRRYQKMREYAYRSISGFTYNRMAEKSEQLIDKVISK